MPGTEACLAPPRRDASDGQTITIPIRVASANGASAISNLLIFLKTDPAGDALSYIAIDLVARNLQLFYGPNWTMWPLPAFTPGSASVSWGALGKIEIIGYNFRDPATTGNELQIDLTLKRYAPQVGRFQFTLAAFDPVAGSSQFSVPWMAVSAGIWDYTPAATGDFTFTAPTSITAAYNQAATFTGTLTPVGGAPGLVSLSTSEPGVVITPASIAINDLTARTVTISAPPRIAPYLITLSAQAGGIPAKMRTVSVGITPPLPTFDITYSGRGLVLNAGDSGQIDVTVHPANGFTGRVTLSSSNAGFSVTPLNIDINSPGTSVSGTLSVGVARGTMAAQTSINLQAQSASLIRSVTIPFQITGDPDLYVYFYQSASEITAGQTATYSGWYNVDRAYSGLVEIQLLGLPPGADYTPKSFFQTHLPGQTYNFGIFITTQTGNPGSFVLSSFIKAGRRPSSGGGLILKTLAVGQPSFSLSVSSSTPSARAGTTAALSLQGQSANGLAGTPNITIQSTLPSGVAFEMPQPLVLQGNTTSSVSLRITIPERAFGRHQVVIRGETNGVLSSTVALIDVQPKVPTCPLEQLVQ